MYAVPRGRRRRDADARAPTPDPPPDLPPLLGPVHFEWHFHEGESFTSTSAAGRSRRPASAPPTRTCGGRVVVDCGPFDWVEESAADDRPPARPVQAARRAAQRPSRRGLASAARCSPTPAGRWRSTRPTCRCAGTSRREDVRGDLLTPSDATLHVRLQGPCDVLLAARRRRRDHRRRLDLRRPAARGRAGARPPVLLRRAHRPERRRGRLPRPDTPVAVPPRAPSWPEPGYFSCGSSCRAAAGRRSAAGSAGCPRRCRGSWSRGPTSPAARARCSRRCRPAPRSAA